MKKENNINLYYHLDHDFDLNDDAPDTLRVSNMNQIGTEILVHQCPGRLNSQFKPGTFPFKAKIIAVGKDSAQDPNQCNRVLIESPNELFIFGPKGWILNASGGLEDWHVEEKYINKEVLYLSPRNFTLA